MRISRPRGVIPRAKGCSVPPQFAEIAENVNVTSSRFEPWRQSVELLTFPFTVCRAHIRNCCWTGTDDPHATYVDAGVDRKTYLSSPTDRPMVTDTVCDIEWTCLGYPVPADPTLHPDPGECVVKGPDTEYRSYLITYGTDCEEGPPSCPSEHLLLNKDSSVGLALPTPPEAKWGATTVRVYRSQSTWDSSKGFVDFNPNALDTAFTSTQTDADYFLISELDINAGYYIDTGVEETGEVLTSEDLLPPPEGAIIAGDTESGSLVAWWDKTLSFSHRNEYWGFPLGGYHDFPFCIQDVKICGNSVFVITQGGVYLATDTGDCKESLERSILEVKSAPPPAACVSCSELPTGVLYTSPEGLVYLTQQGDVSIASRTAFEKDDWRQLGTIRELSTGCGLILLSTDQGEVLWELSFDKDRLLPADVYTLSFPVQHWLEDDQDNLYYLQGDTVFQFNSGPDYMMMDWLQSEQRTQRKKRLSTIEVEYVKKNSPNHNVMSVYRDGCESATEVMGHKPLRIRSSSSDCTQIRVKGNEPMCAIAYGQGFSDLRGDQ